MNTKLANSYTGGLLVESAVKTGSDDYLVGFKKSILSKYKLF